MEETRHSSTRQRRKQEKRPLLRAAMKGVTALAVMLLLPLGLMAMTPVGDASLSDVTGQAGVNINADLTMNLHIGTIAWGDSDGIGGFNSGTDTSPWATVSSGGYIAITQNVINSLRIKARESDTYNGYHSSTAIKPITIDVATGTKLGIPNTTFVRIGTGSLQISAESMSRVVEFGPTPALGQVLGTAHGGAMNVYYNPESYIDIWAHSGCGVNIELNLVIDEFDISYISWGDTDGLPGGNPGNAGGVGNWIAPAGSAGYAGARNVVVGGPISVKGTICIDVVSIAAGQGAYAGQGLDPILGQGACSVVHISLPTNVVLMTTGPITCEIRYDRTASLDSLDSRKLWDYYLQGANITVGQGSWLDIWAH